MARRGRVQSSENARDKTFFNAVRSVGESTPSDWTTSCFANTVNLCTRIVEGVFNPVSCQCRIAISKSDNPSPGSDGGGYEIIIARVKKDHGRPQFTTSRPSVLVKNGPVALG